MLVRPVMHEDLEAIIKASRERYGDDAVRSALAGLRVGDDASTTLTILCSAGTHHIPPEYLRGCVHVVKTGSVDLSSGEAFKADIIQSLMSLAALLKGNKWTKIFLIPTGHPGLSMQIKLLVFWVTRIETTDVVYLGEGRYAEIKLDQRDLIQKS